MRIRPLSKADLPSVVSLHVRARYGDVPYASEPTVSYLNKLLFANPHRHDKIRSLVCEDESGSIVGFWGVIPRRMRLRNRTLLVAVGFLLNVAPEVRKRGIGTQLLSVYLDGPQDLSISDRATEAFKRIYLPLGGTVAPLNTLVWHWPLRPARHALTLVRKKNLPISKFLFWAGPLCDIADSFLKAKIEAHYSLKLIDNPLNSNDLLECTRKLHSNDTFQFEESHTDLSWFVEILNERNSAGELHILMCNNDTGALIGWCVYGVHDNEVEILFINYVHKYTQEFMWHVEAKLYRAGYTVVHGRLKKTLFDVMYNKNIYITMKAHWALFHTNDVELKNLILRGDVNISRLDGGWWLRFPRYIDPKLLPH